LDHGLRPARPRAHSPALVRATGRVLSHRRGRSLLRRAVQLRRAARGDRLRRVLQREVPVASTAPPCRLSARPDKGPHALRRNRLFSAGSRVAMLPGVEDVTMRKIARALFVIAVPAFAACGGEGSSNEPTTAESQAAIQASTATVTIQQSV